MFKQHLQEIASSPQTESVLVRYLQAKLKKVSEIIKLFLESEKKIRIIEKLPSVLKSLQECWSVFEAIFLFPQCKLASILD